MNEPKRINKSELEAIGRALRANVKAAKATITALGPKLKAEFEVQLNLTYPASGDPVWFLKAADQSQLPGAGEEP